MTRCNVSSSVYLFLLSDEDHETIQTGSSYPDLRSIFSWAYDVTDNPLRSDSHTTWRSSPDLSWEPCSKSTAAAAAPKPFERDSGPSLPIIHANDDHPISALEYFHLFVPPSIFQVACKETNSYAEFYQDRKRDSGGKNWYDWVDESWFPVTGEEEMRAFLGICLVMGVKRLPNPHDYWSESDMLREKLIADSMSAERFSKLMQYFYLSNPWRDPERIENPDRREAYRLQYPLYKLSDSLWPSIQNGCSTLYTPHRDLVLRQLRLDKNENCCCQVLTAKGEHEEGEWRALTLEDATNGYIHKAEFSMCRHKNHSSDIEVFPSDALITTLLEDTAGKHHRVYADTVFISPLTACKLVDLGFEVSADFSSWPPAFSDEGLKEEQTSYRYKEVVVSAWKSEGSNRIRRHLRTFEDGQQADTSMPADKHLGCPMYQHDLVVKPTDERYLLSNSTVLSMLTKSDWKVIFWAMIDIGLNNASILWNESDRDMLSLTEFTMEVASGLLGVEGPSRRKSTALVSRKQNLTLQQHEQRVVSFPQMLPGSLLMPVNPTVSPSPMIGNNLFRQGTTAEVSQTIPSSSRGHHVEPAHSLVKFPGRGRNCRQCTAEKLRTRSGRRHDTQFGCNVCGINLCRLNCFVKFHTRNRLEINRVSITRIDTLDHQPPARKIKWM